MTAIDRSHDGNALADDDTMTLLLDDVRSDHHGAVLLPATPKSKPPTRPSLVSADRGERSNTRRMDRPQAYNEELTRQYDEMRTILADLNARNVPLPPGPWAHESCGMHLRLFFQHLYRAFVVLLTPVSWRTTHREDPLMRQRSVSLSERSTKLMLDDGTEVPTSDDGSPAARALAANWLIMPVGTWKEKWDILVLVLILYSAVVVPLRVCFDYEASGSIWYFEVGITFAFLLDIAFTFNTVFFDPNLGNWVLSRSRIATSYARSWLWIDLPASFPVELIDAYYKSDTGALQMLRFLRMLRLLRLLRLLKIDEYIETLENQFDVNLRILRILFILLRICFLAHLLGCFWFGTHLLSAADEDQETWARDTFDVEDAAIGRKYLFSVYWAVTTLTTVGYGDITPTNDSERGYALASMLCSALSFGYMMSNISSLVASMDRQAALVEEKTDSVKEYVAWRSLPRDLALRVKKHYSFYFTRRPAFNEVELLDGLSPSLRSEVTRFVLKNTLGKLPLFSKPHDPEFQMEVFPLLKPVFYRQGEIVFKRGEPSRDLFFLLTGEVSVFSSITGVVQTRITPEWEITVSQQNVSEEIMRTEHTGCFGESVLTGRRRPATHVASAWSEMLILTKGDLISLFDRSPRSARRITQRLLTELNRKGRLSVLLLRFLLNASPPKSETRSALVIQIAWKRNQARVAAQTESVLSHVKGAELEDFDDLAQASQTSSIVPPAQRPAAPPPPATGAVAAEELVARAESKVALLLSDLAASLAEPRRAQANGH